MYCADLSGVLVFFGYCQKSILILHGYARKGAAEESDFNGLKVHVFQGGKVLLDGAPRIFGGYISLPGSDFFLVAENTVVGTAPVGYENRDNSMFFQSTIPPR